MRLRISRCLTLARFGILAAASLLAASAQAQTAAPPSPAPPPAWFSARSAHIEAVSSAGAERARALALQLERALAAASTLVGAAPARLPPVRAIELTPSAGYSYLRPLSGAAAFLHVAPDGATLVLDASLPEQARTAAQHALVHLLAASDPDPLRPLWLEEGAAEFVSTARVVGNALELGRPPRARLEWFALATLHPLKRVLSARETLRWSQHAREGFAAESWALLHFVLESDQLGFPDREAQLARYLTLMREGAPEERACTEAFGATPAELEAELLRYLSFGELPRHTIPLAALAVGDVAAPAPLAPADSDALLGELAFALGESARTPAERWLRSAALRQPAAKALLARLRAERGDELALIEPLLVEAELADPHAAATLRALGRARLTLAVRGGAPADAAQLAEAERLVRASARAAPSAVSTQLALAELARARGELPEAEAQLRDAQQRAPADGAIDIALARFALDANDQSEARAQLARVLARPHEDMRGTSADEFEALLRRARVAAGGPIATRHLTAHLEVSAPPAVRGVSEVEIAGRGGRWEAAFHDVVIALDESQSTLVATGHDIDGNGRVSRNRTWDRHVESIDGLVQFQASADPGDAVVSAEVVAAERLIAQLDPETMRVGLVSFAGVGWVDAPLGHPSAVLRQLATYAPGYHDNGTSIAAALRSAFDALNAARDPERARHRAILLLSDGQPTNPSRKQGMVEALEAADELAHYGVPVHTFALGREALAFTPTYREIAARTGGRFVPVEHPAEVVSLLRSVRLTGLDKVTIRNLTTQQLARGFRMLPDGSFRASVPVALGKNLIEVTAKVEGREPLSVRRQVTVYEGAASADALAPADPKPSNETEAQAKARELRERRRLEIEWIDDEANGDEAGEKPYPPPDPH